jgi:hypothetical protein
MRTWHLQIRPLIIWWARFDICIVTLGTTHLVPHVHVFIWLKMCFKVLAHQSPTFVSDIVIMIMIFTLGTLVQVEACFKNVENTLRMVQDVLHLDHHLRKTARASNQVGGPINSFSSPSRSPGAAFTKTDAQVAYGLYFWCSLYGWTDNFITLPMALASGPSSFGVDRYCPNKLTSRICPDAAMLFFGLWALYHVGAHRGVSRGSCTTLGTLLADTTPSLGFGFCF